MYPQGYITADSMVGTQTTTDSDDTGRRGEKENLLTLQLLNLPITSTIKLHIHYVDMEMSGLDSLRKLYAGQPGNQRNSRPLPIDIFSTQESVWDAYRALSGNSTLTFQYRQNSHQSQMSSVRLSYIGEDFLSG